MSKKEIEQLRQQIEQLKAENAAKDKTIALLTKNVKKFNNTRGTRTKKTKRLDTKLPNKGTNKVGQVKPSLTWYNEPVYVNKDGIRYLQDEDLGWIAIPYIKKAISGKIYYLLTESPYNSNNYYEDKNGTLYKYNPQTQIFKKMIEDKVYPRLVKESNKKEQEESWFDLTYDAYKFTDSSQNEDSFKTIPDLHYYFQAKNMTEAKKIAEYKCDIKAQEKDGIEFDVWQGGYKFVSLEEDLKNNHKTSDLRRFEMYESDPDKIVEYSVMGADANKPVPGLPLSCVLRYVIQKLSPYTYKKGTTRAKLPQCLRDETYYNTYFNTLKRDLENVKSVADPNDLFPDVQSTGSAEEDKSEINKVIPDPTLTGPVGGITPFELEIFCKQFGISHKCIDTVSSTILNYVGNKSIAITYVTNGDHLYPIKDLSQIRKVRERSKNKKNAKPYTPKAEGKPLIEGDYIIEESVDIAEQKELSGLVFLHSQDNLNDFFFNVMISDNIIFDKTSYEGDDEGNIIKFSPDDTVTYKINQKVIEVIDICKKMDIPFTGQSYNSLGLQIIEKTRAPFGLEYCTLNSQVYNTLMTTSRSAICNNLNKIQNPENNFVMYDVNKQFSGILADEGNNFPIFDVFCEVQNVKHHEVKTYEDSTLYLIRTDNFFPFRYSGLYYGFMLKYAKSIGIIFEVTGMIVPSSFHKSFREDVISIYSKLGPNHGKEIINTFIGLCAKNRRKITNAYYDQFLNNANYICNKYIPNGGMIFKVNEEPDIFQIKSSEIVPCVQNNMPLNLYVIQKCCLDMHKIATQIGGNLIRVMVDSVIIENPETELIKVPELDNIFVTDLKEPYNDSSLSFAGTLRKISDKEVKSRIQTIKGTNIPRKDQNKKSLGFKLPQEAKPWRTIDVNEINWRDPEWIKRVAEIIFENKSAFLHGWAGTGKSTIFDALREMLFEKNITKYFTAPTNVAARNIKGSTLHRFFGLSATDPISKSITKHAKRGDWFFVDEIGMVHSSFFAAILKLKKKGVNIIVAGDFDQLGAVQDKINRYQKKNCYILREICDSNLINLQICKRSDPGVFDLGQALLKDIPIDDLNPKYSDEPVSEDEFHICYKNRTRQKINREIMLKKVKGLSEDKFCRVFATTAKDNKSIPAMWLTEGAPIHCYKSNRKYGNALNGDNFKVHSWSKPYADKENGVKRPDTIYLIRDSIIYDADGKEIENEKFPVTSYQFPKFFVPGYASTCHKAQGATIKGKIRIWDHKFSRVDKHWLYTAVTRATKIDNIYFAGDTIKNKLHVEEIDERIIAARRLQSRGQIELARNQGNC